MKQIIALLLLCFGDVPFKKLSYGVFVLVSTPAVILAFSFFKKK